jgi:hypothetical protein
MTFFKDSCWQLLTAAITKITKQNKKNAHTHKNIFLKETYTYNDV